MKLGRRQVFEQVDPPAGGLARLRARLDVEQGRARRAGFWVAASTVALTAIAVAGAALAPRLGLPAEDTTGSPVDSLPGTGQMGPALASLGLAPVAAEPVSVPSAERGATAVERVPLPTDDVVFYLVATRTEAGARDRQTEKLPVMGIDPDE